MRSDRPPDEGGEPAACTISAKVFAGFVNWLGHCMSDAAEGSGSKSRGQGLPIPFTEFFQLCYFGRFPNEKGQWQSFSSAMTQVYEQGYSLRHEVAATFPVIVNDPLVRSVYVVKRRFANGLGWKECLPEGRLPGSAASSDGRNRYHVPYRPRTCCSHILGKLDKILRRVQYLPLGRGSVSKGRKSFRWLLNGRTKTSCQYPIPSPRSGAGFWSVVTVS